MQERIALLEPTQLASSWQAPPMSLGVHRLAAGGQESTLLNGAKVALVLQNHLCERHSTKHAEPAESRSSLVEVGAALPGALQLGPGGL